MFCAQHEDGIVLAPLSTDWVWYRTLILYHLNAYPIIQFVMVSQRKCVEQWRKTRIWWRVSWILLWLLFRGRFHGKEDDFCLCYVLWLSPYIVAPNMGHSQKVKLDHQRVKPCYCVQLIQTFIILAQHSHLREKALGHAELFSRLLTQSQNLSLDMWLEIKDLYISPSHRHLLNNSYIWGGHFKSFLI